MKNVVVGLIISFTDNAPSLLTNTTFWAVVFCEGVMLPLTCMPRMKGVSYISSFTSVLPIFVLIIAGIHYFMNGDKLTGKTEIVLFSSNPGDYLESFSLILYPLMVHPNLLTIFSELINPTHKRKFQSLFNAFLAELVIFSTIAYFNYLYFAKDVTLLI